LLYLVTSKGFWRRLGYINAKLAKLFTFWIIEWDEFLIQEMAINKAKEDRQIIKKQADNLFAQVAQKNEELSEAHNKMVEAQGMINELQSQGRTDADPEMELASNDYMRQKDFVDSITPLRAQIEELAQICQKVYNDTGNKIRDAEAELKVQKTKLASVTAGESAMNKALSIFTGENPDVTLANEAVKRKIGEKIGSIRGTLDIITPIMNERSLRDKVKVKRALAELKQSGAATIPVSENASFVRTSLLDR
jgi:hypothetical protein